MPATAEKEALPRSLGLFGAITIVVGITIGSGIFRSPAGIADRLPGPGPMLPVWAFDGWADVTFAGGEVKDGARNLPRAIILGSLAVLVIYLLANLAYLSVLPIDALRTSRLVAGDVGEKVMGSAGIAFVAITVMLSTFGSLNSTMLANPRVFFAMAEDGLFFKPMAAVHPRFKTPVNAIALAALLGIAFVLLRRFEDLADAFVTAILPFYVLGVGAIFVLRRRPGYAPAFRSPGYPIVPILFILATLYLLVNAVIDPSTRWPTLAVFLVILVGIPVFYTTVGRRVIPPDTTRRAVGETA